ncbi:MAG: DUF2442 domain-containing protein [Tepidiformaceae bacterium]
MHEIFRVTDVAVVGISSLRLRFDDGTERTIDFEPLLTGDLLGPLRDAALFSAVRLDPETHTVTWPNGGTSTRKRSATGLNTKQRSQNVLARGDRPEQRGPDCEGSLADSVRSRRPPRRASIREFR